MKNPEEDILKRFLQDTFSDYEPEPNEQTWENIRKEIQPQQPNVGAGLRRFVVPTVALLLLVGGFVWDNNFTENKTELALNSKKESLNNETQVLDNQYFKNNKFIKKRTLNAEESERINVNKTTSKVESTVVPKIEKSLEIPTFSTILTEPMAKQNVQEYSVSTKEMVGIEDESSVVMNLTNTVNTDNNVGKNNAGWVKPIVELPASVRSKSMTSKNSEIIQNEQNSNSITQTEKSNENQSENTIYHNPINDAVIEEIRTVKPLEIIKNKDFVLVKNDLPLPQIKDIFINKDQKPLRRPTYMSVSLTPIQTYRILTVNHLGVQNLQTNNLFDAERNGWAFELGITKPMGNKWNFRGGISYLKMRQWAEYQVNTNIISVRNANNYINTSVAVSNGNEFIEQTRIEQKTLQMVGLKADVQKFFKVSGRNRYFIGGGSQLMYEPTQRQTNVFINASAGFQHVVNKDCFLTIEPTASYLLNNINDSKSLIQTNAYNLGLKVGVNFRVK